MLVNNYEKFEHNDARWLNIKILNIDPVKSMYYDILALKECIKYIKEKGTTLFINPDEHE